MWFLVQMRQVEQSWKQLLLFAQQRYPNLPYSLNPQDLHVGVFLLVLGMILKYSFSCAEQEKQVVGYAFIKFSYFYFFSLFFFFFLDSTWSLDFISLGFTSIKIFLNN